MYAKPFESSGQNTGQGFTFFTFQVNHFPIVPFVNRFTKIFCTQQYCHVEFPFKFFDEMLNKGDFLKFIHLYFSVIKKGVKKEASLWIYRVLTVVCIIDIKDQNIKGLGKGILENKAVCNKAG